MSEFDVRLHSGLTALAERIEPLASADEVMARLGRSTRQRKGVALRVTVVAAVVLAIVVTVVALRDGDDQAVVDVGPPPTTVAPRPVWHPTGMAPGWHGLPDGPLGPLYPRAMVWTGSELIVWRGEGGLPERMARAASFAPAIGEWTELPPDPLDVPYLSGVGVGGAWTGTEALFWAAEGMVAWDPSNATWRDPAPPPHPHERDGVWTDNEVVFWADGLAYDPFADSWREIARPSDYLTALVNDDADGVLWNGQQVVVVGGLSGAYDPATDSWREFGPPLTDRPDATIVAWDGATALVTQFDDEIVAFDFTPDSTASLDLAQGTWTERPDLAPPIDPSGTLTVVPFDDGRVLLAGGNDVQLRNLDGTWTPVSQPPSPGLLFGNGEVVFSYSTVAPRFVMFVPPAIDPAASPGWDASTLGQGWHVLDRGPLPPGSPYVLEASPFHLFVYGFSTSEDVPVGRAFTYELATGTWTELPPSPLTSAQALGGAWTGEEFAVWSTSGVAFWDAGGARWRAASAPPRSLDAYPYWGGDGGWTGSHVVFWANRLKYDIAHDEWEDIPSPPVVPSRASSAFDGNELIVVGLADEDAPITTAQMAFAPATNRWRLLPASGLDGQELDLTTLVGADGRRTVLAVDYQNNVAVYESATNTWRAIDPLPLDTGEDSRTVVALDGGRAFVTSTWTGQALLGVDGRWTTVTGGPGGFVAAALDGGVVVFGEQVAIFVP